MATLGILNPVIPFVNCASKTSDKALNLLCKSPSHGDGNNPSNNDCYERRVPYQGRDGTGGHVRGGSRARSDVTLHGASGEDEEAAAKVSRPDE